MLAFNNPIEKTQLKNAVPTDPGVFHEKWADESRRRESDCLSSSQGTFVTVIPAVFSAYRCWKEFHTGLREKVVFDDVNIFKHSLTDAFVDVSLRGRSLTAENRELIGPEDIAPDVGTPGMAPKARVRRDNTFKLFKDGQERDVKAELLASKIADCFDVEAVNMEEILE